METKADYLVGVYQYFNPIPEEGGEAAYYLLYLLDQKGLLEKEEAERLYNEKFQQNFPTSKWLGPFESLDNLNQFSFLLCEKLNAQKISLLSVQEYNELLEQSLHATDFQRDLLKKGNVLENIDRKEKGFFKRFFT